MASIKYVDSKDNARTVDAGAASTVMQAALDNMIDGIVGECGGSCSCGTCHCYVDTAWLDKLPPLSEIERQTLECAIDVRPNSRLSCQLRITEELDGLVIHLPESQL